ncbi:hypothetical protein DPMN_077091 [Dreissena polymorpha]|uniref:Uncharacterized protein n=1 Tax=Dreissena polymorpha TaxID=45954 RepID=A0A9D3YJU6_DREPO|nr:hypothetical protein DPMN_077091 [Dreissena polymorpha]
MRMRVIDYDYDDSDANAAADDAAVVPNKNRRPTLYECNHETADSVNCKDAQHYGVSDISGHATPSDAVTGGSRRARPRSSIIEGEYDTILSQSETRERFKYGKRIRCDHVE